MKKKEQKNIKKTEEPKVLPGYPLYPDSEDIYNKEEEVRNVNFDNLSSNISTTEEVRLPNEKDLNEKIADNELDVPGAELDNKSEIAGSEDEENNYYSLGGDNHTDLEKNKEE